MVVLPYTAEFHDYVVVRLQIPADESTSGYEIPRS
jgi:hypothetical protein